MTELPLALGATAETFEPKGHRDPEFARAFFEGMRNRPRSVPCKYFYDSRGSALFDRICELPEYYPTRTELGIMEANATAIEKKLLAMMLASFSFSLWT